MVNNRKVLAFFLFITFLLLLRDIPYFNVLIINKLWIVYIFVIAIIALFFVSRKKIYLGVAFFFLLFLALILTLAGVIVGADAIGIVIYILVWLVVIQKIFALIREKV